MNLEYLDNENTRYVMYLWWYQMDVFKLYFCILIDHWRSSNQLFLNPNSTGAKVPAAIDATPETGFPQ